MTKLFQWLLCISLYVAVWLAVLTRRVHNAFLDEWIDIVKFSPVIIAVLFGVCSLTIILWRVYTFNDCPQAAAELHEQIKKTKEELKRKGLEF
uniref:Dolichol-phosphate mannosyltransferase subunit 3 n=1 Tax=Panstrongylus lignarius TaxID=156445 RepID=A0A224XVD6_9HEMI